MMKGNNGNGTEVMARQRNRFKSSQEATKDLWHAAIGRLDRDARKGGVRDAHP